MGARTKCLAFSSCLAFNCCHLVFMLDMDEEGLPRLAAYLGITTKVDFSRGGFLDFTTLPSSQTVMKSPG